MIKFIAIILFLCFSLFGLSQDRDAGLWADISIEKRFTQSFSIGYSNSERFNENISELGNFINELSIKYRFSKKSKLAVSYRYSLKKELNNMYEPRSRFSMDFTQEFELGDIDVDIRLKYQTQKQNVEFYDYDSDSKNTLRSRIKLSYKIKKFKPYLFAESFHPVWYEDYQPMSKLRASVGVDYEFNNNNSVDVAYMIQREFFECNPVTDFVFKFGYKYSF